MPAARAHQCARREHRRRRMARRRHPDDHARRVATPGAGLAARLRGMGDHRWSGVGLRRRDRRGTCARRGGHRRRRRYYRLCDGQSRGHRSGCESDPHRVQRLYASDQRLPVHRPRDGALGSGSQSDDCVRFVRARRHRAARHERCGGDPAADAVRHELHDRYHSGTGVGGEMPTGLFTPILNDRTRAPYFFNGRLLTGETMTAEQRAQHVAHDLLARGLGDGVANGLQVELSKDFNSVDRPVVTVKAGAAISRRGDLLLLNADTEIELVRPATASAAPQRIFEACNPPQQGAYVADAGVYLLTIAPITVGEGLAPVSGLGGGNGCNVKYRVDAVQFRLARLPVDNSLLADANQRRNRIAYACFGIDQYAAFARDPFGGADEPHTLLDDVDGKTIGECDVPLAVMYWTATGGISFLDMWSVRRRLARSWTAARVPPLSDKRRATAEAMLLQFEEQIATLRRSLGQSATIFASTYFRF